MEKKRAGQEEYFERERERGRERECDENNKLGVLKI